MNITASRLRALREEMGLSQRDVARRLGITRAAYNKYECGASKPIRRLSELSALFGVSADYILGKDSTEFETALCDAGPRAESQVRKYLRLSRDSRELIDIILDALYKREHESKA